MTTAFACATNAPAGEGMRVLGIDPGSHVLGFGLVERRGSRLCHIAHGTVRAGRAPLPGRLARLYEGLAEVIAAHAPSAVAMEGLFTFRNARSALTLAHARGVALLCAARAGLPVHEYAPAQVKRAVGAPSAAQKAQVMRLVGLLLGLPSLSTPDCADALAAAVCHLGRARVDGAREEREATA